MGTFPQRSAHTFWDNETPITDLHEAISLLASEASSNEPVHLARNPRGEDHDWEIVVPWYREGSSGGDSSGEHYYQIDGDLALALVTDRLVIPHIVKYFGGSHVDPDRLVLAEHARAASCQRERELTKAATAMLEPGIHTDLSGIPKLCGRGREHWRYGRFWVKFETPLGDVCKVYPEHNEIVFPA